MRLCKHSSCDEKHLARGWCKKHYGRVMAHGTPDAPQERANWKGDAASYSAKHHYIGKYYGKASRCENPDCNFLNPKRFEWANISGEYKRDRSDYIQLCPSCHRRYDNGNVCKRGHEFTEENTLIAGSNKHRRCRACNRQRLRDRRLRHKQEAERGGRSF